MTVPVHGKELYHQHIDIHVHYTGSSHDIVSFLQNLQQLFVIDEKGSSKLIETLSNPQQSWGESCTQVAITKATEKNSVVYYVRV